MKTSELTGKALDWAVGVAQGLLSNPSDTDWYAPSTNWAQGGPIIDKANITVGGCSANIGDNDCYFGATNLMAAMRCYVTSKMGNEVDVPEVLT